MLRENCPRCGVQNTTFSVIDLYIDASAQITLFCLCRNCEKIVNFWAPMFNQRSFYDNQQYNFYINEILYSLQLQEPALLTATPCPEHTPDHVTETFNEATRCMAISCWNAAGAMFRKTIDLATRDLVKEDENHKIGDKEYISWKIYKDIGLRIEWLLERNLIGARITPLIECIREDGNDAAHAAETLDEIVCGDLFDFTVTVLRSVFTEPGQLAANIQRRKDRREST